MFSFLFNFKRCFSIFVFACVLLSKTDCFVLGFLLFLVFQVVSINSESGFQKNKLSSFSLGLTWSEYRGTLFNMRLVL